MSPPIARPFPCFIADSPQEGKPYGRWAERLTEEFARACEPHAGEAGGRLRPRTPKGGSGRGGGGRGSRPAPRRAPQPTGGGAAAGAGEASPPPPAARIAPPS